MIDDVTPFSRGGGGLESLSQTRKYRTPLPGQT